MPIGQAVGVNWAGRVCVGRYKRINCLARSRLVRPSVMVCAIMCMGEIVNH